MTWAKLVWRLVFWPFAAVAVLASEGGWRIFWVVTMAFCGLLLEGMRFAADRLLAINETAIALRDREITWLRGGRA